MANLREVRLGSALFNGDHGHLAEELSRLKEARIDFLHLDVFDGHLVPDLGFSPRTIAALRPLTDMPFEVHLAAKDPLRFVPALAEAGADMIILHIESVSMVYEALFEVREHGVKASLAFTLGTSLMQLDPVLPYLDAVLMLARVTGEGSSGASFHTQVIPRLERAREMIDREGTPIDLQVAGGVNRDSIVSVVDAGASSIALGAGLYRAADMQAEVQLLRSLIAERAPA